MRHELQGTELSPGCETDILKRPGSPRNTNNLRNQVPEMLKILVFDLGSNPHEESPKNDGLVLAAGEIVPIEFTLARDLAMSLSQRLFLSKLAHTEGTITSAKCLA
jgi:hypothetical protein